ncbi:MAG: lipid-binding SYLF domain-containing protein [Thermoguttaceae bacterium]|nr:lipid-binding SYLF domain-containing protein [Thermoguttaceae bacterium]
MRHFCILFSLTTICLLVLPLSAAFSQGPGGYPPVQVQMPHNPPGAEMAKATGDIADSLQVLNEIMEIPVNAIPTSMLKRAEGLVIIPNMIKGGFAVGGAYGRGVFMVRQPGGAWSHPNFVSMAKGSFGFQAGVSSTDIVLVFCTKRSIEQFTEGKLTLGVDAAVAAGPVGRQAEAGTDLTLTSEVYSYSRARGVFLGAAIDGGILNIDKDLTNRYYAAAGSPMPPTAWALVKALNAYSGVPNAPGEPLPPTQAPAPKPVYQGPSLEVLRPQVAAAYAQLSPLLDQQWKAFLAVPPEFFTPERSPLPPKDKVHQALNHYRAVANNEQYKVLNMRPEFQTVYQLLNQWDIAATQLEAMVRDANAAPAPVPRPINQQLNK